MNFRVEDCTGENVKEVEGRETFQHESAAMGIEILRELLGI